MFGRITYNNLQSESLIKVTTLSVGSEQNLRVRIDNKHLLSEGGIVGVEWQEHVASLEDGENGKDLGDTTFGANSDYAVRTDALLAQQMRESVGFGTELSVGKILILKLDSNGCGRPFGLSLDELMQLALRGNDTARGRQLLCKTRVLVVADSRNIVNLDVRIPSETVDLAAIRVQNWRAPSSRAVADPESDSVGHSDLAELAGLGTTLGRLDEALEDTGVRDRWEGQEMVSGKVSAVLSRYS